MSIPIYLEDNIKIYSSHFNWKWRLYGYSVLLSQVQTFACGCITHKWKERLLIITA